MDRTEKVGLAVAGAGHLALLAALALGFAAAPNPEKLKPQPIEVSLAPEIAPVQSAPPAPEPPSASVAPDVGAPEDAAPPEVAPLPAPEPKPSPAPKPEPSPKPSAEPKPAPKPFPKPAPKPSPAAKPKPKPAEPAVEEAKPAPRKSAKPAPDKATPAKTVLTKPATTAKPDAAKGSGSTPTATTARLRGSHLGSDFLKGLSADAPATAKPSAAAPGATMNAKATADIGSAILRQVQPCANRQVTPGPGAERIRVAINLKLNRDGSLAAPPRVVNHSGVDDDNSRYLDRVDDLAVATFTGCAPLKGLPAELYDVQNGWRNFTLRYKLPG